MEEDGIKPKKLKIDEGFKNLIRPLYQQEYLQLEANILADGCRNPITVWNGVIIDGHNRYEICTRHGIPFEVDEMDFECREEAIAWICANQLGRRNLTNETRKFLIGMQYESEKIVNQRRNISGRNQFTPEDPTLPYETFNPTEVLGKTAIRNTTAQAIAESNHISHGTVEKYAVYTRALEEIGKKAPGLVPKILSGKYKISHNGVLELARMPTEDVQSVNRRLERSQQPFAQYQTTRHEIQKVTREPSCRTESPQASVKDMPEYDPDEQITGLTLTIPSWESLIRKVRSDTHLDENTDTAKTKLKRSLLNLRSTVDEFLSILMEE